MSDPVVTIAEGQLRGTIAQNYLGEVFYSFLGIPYGKPPIGKLRFKAPLPAESWDGIKDATKEGPECPSKHLFFLYYVGSEDNCLNLNVYTRQLPTSRDSTPRPVMVWIHGGAFVSGSNKREVYGPDYLMMEDIVLVTINYRLGIFGFLSLEDPSLGVPGNAGLKDMVLALKWVQKNIKNFNGDPNNVTIFGESAGSASVHLLYLSPLTKGLFHKAIAQSGCALNPWVMGRSNGLETAEYLGCKASSEKEILEYLVSLPAHRIVKAQNKAYDPFTANNVRPYGPVVEKPSNESSFLPEHPENIMKSGKFNQVPLIMGYNSIEGLFMEAVKWTNWEFIVKDDLEREVDHNLNLVKGSEKSKNVAANISKFYFKGEKSLKKNLDKFYLLKTDAMFVHGIHRSIRNQKLKTNFPIYLYRMTLDTSMNYLKLFSTVKMMPFLFIFYFIAHMLNDGMLKNLFLKLAKLLPRYDHTGATHADDLCYLFKLFFNDRLESDSIEERSVRRFVKLWTNFAKTGNPTPEKDHVLDDVQWKPVSREVNHFLDIGTDLKSGSNPDSDRMQFWDQFYE